MGLFQRKRVSLHSGMQSEWKIECDFLDESSILTLAYLGMTLLPPFGVVEGVPRGGLGLAEAMLHYALPGGEGPLLIVDDVLTTGGSMIAQRADRNAIGLVIFARGDCPDWVTPIFSFNQG